MLKVKSININKEGKRIDYSYSCKGNTNKYFEENNPFFAEYDIDIHEVPESILIIPFLANMIQISWYVGFDVYINEIDEEFYNSLNFIKEKFIESHPEIKSKSSTLHFSKLVKNNYQATRTAMLFSGGVDALATYFRHYETIPDLITAHGADIELDDTEQWNTLVNINEKEELLKDNKKLYVKSNFTTFYTYKVNTLLGLKWWAYVQHGLGLNGILAPLSFVRGYKLQYIASTYTDQTDFSWGSSPEIDNHLKWGNTGVVHDAYELKRQDKVDLIISKLNELDKKINIRVCYSILNTSVNCSKCEKCYRTIMGIILMNDNPNLYGFNVSQNVYNQILSLFNGGFESMGVQYFWTEIYDKIKEEKEFYVFENKQLEQVKINELRDLIELNIKSGLKEKSSSDKFKQKIINTFPKLFRSYIKFRTERIKKKK